MRRPPPHSHNNFYEGSLKFIVYVLTDCSLLFLSLFVFRRDFLSFSYKNWAKREKFDNCETESSCAIVKISARELINKFAYQIITHTSSSCYISFHRATRFRRMSSTCECLFIIVSSASQPRRVWLKWDENFFEMYFGVWLLLFSTLWLSIAFAIVILIFFAIFTSFNISIYNFYTLISCRQLSNRWWSWWKVQYHFEFKDWGRKNIYLKIFNLFELKMTFVNFSNLMG